MVTSIDYDTFRALRVTHVATSFEELIKDEANDHLTPEQLFLTAVDAALEQRRHSRVEKLIRQARFPIPHASVAEIDYRDGRGITGVRMRRYAAHDWRADPTNVLIISPSGGGKTYLACAIGISACLNEHTVSYARMDDLARRLVITRSDGIAHQQLLNELSDVDLLIIDLIGATTTRAGLNVHAELDDSTYPTGIRISEAEMASLPIEAHEFHPDWNYTLNPRKSQ